MSGLNLLRRGFNPLREHPWLALMGVTSVAAVLILVAFFLLIGRNVQSAVSDWSRDFQVIIYLDPSPHESLAREWQTALGSMVEIEEVDYISSSEALKRFRTRLGNDASLIDGISSDVLPGSFELKLHPEFRHRDAIKSLVDRISQKNEWKDVHYGREWVERFDALRRLIRMTGTTFGFILMIIVFLIVANTIRLILLTRKTEIEVFRLLGATPLYIGLPFLLEGGVLGALGGMVALLFVYLFHLFGLQQGLSSVLQILGVERIGFLPPLWQAGLVISGAVLGGIASLVAMRRISKV